MAARTRPRRRRLRDVVLRVVLAVLAIVLVVKFGPAILGGIAHVVALLVENVVGTSSG